MVGGSRKVAESGDLGVILCAPPRSLPIPQRVSVVPRARGPPRINALVVTMLLDIVDRFRRRISEIEKPDITRDFVGELGVSSAQRPRDIAAQQGQRIFEAEIHPN